MATVVRNQRVFDEQGGEDYARVIEFRTEKQELVTFVLDSANTSEPRATGKKILSCPNHSIP